MRVRYLLAGLVLAFLLAAVGVAWLLGPGRDMPNSLPPHTASTDPASNPPSLSPGFDEGSGEDRIHASDAPRTDTENGFSRPGDPPNNEHGSRPGPPDEGTRPGGPGMAPVAEPLDGDEIVPPRVRQILIKGRVVDRLGVPVPDMAVHLATGIDWPGRRADTVVPPNEVARSDQQGRFAVDWKLQTATDLTVMLFAGYDPNRGDVLPFRPKLLRLRLTESVYEDIELLVDDLPVTGAIRGGARLVPAYVHVTFRRVDVPPGHVATPITVSSDEEGRFRAELAPGRWRVGIDRSVSPGRIWESERGPTEIFIPSRRGRDTIVVSVRPVTGVVFNVTTRSRTPPWREPGYVPLTAMIDIRFANGDEETRESAILPNGRIEIRMDDIRQDVDISTVRVRATGFHESEWMPLSLQRDRPVVLTVNLER